MTEYRSCWACNKLRPFPEFYIHESDHLCIICRERRAEQAEPTNIDSVMFAVPKRKAKVTVEPVLIG